MAFALICATTFPLSAQWLKDAALLSYENPFHGMYGAGFGYSAIPGGPDAQWAAITPTLYWDHLGLRISVKHSWSADPVERSAFVMTADNTAIMWGAAATFPIGKKIWRPWIDAQVSAGNAGGQFGAVTGLFNAYEFGAQLRLPVIREKFHLTVCINRTASLRRGEPFQTIDYGIGIAYEHRAKPMR